MHAAARIAHSLPHPPIALAGASVSVLHTPSCFYDALLAGIERARSRVRVAALYIGTGAHEAALVSALGERAREGVDLTVVLDRMRATRRDRDGRSSLSSLAPLVLGARAGRAPPTVGLLHHPRLRGAAAALPARLNEVVGVQHVKAFVFDDDLLLSGANLSRDYFTSRQDRYLLIRAEPAAADAFSAIVDALAECSLTLARPGAEARRAGGGGEVAEVRDAAVEALGLRARAPRHAPPPGEASAAAAAAAVAERMRAALAECAAAPAAARARPDADTWLVPTVQLGAAGLRDDEVAVDAAVALAARGAAPPAPPPRARGPQPAPRALAPRGGGGGGGGGTLTLASAYLNPTPRLLRALRDALGESPALRLELITAASAANGFHGAAPPAGWVPAAYAALEAGALRALAPYAAQGRARLRLWAREGWTYHAKGLWYAPAHPEPPAASARRVGACASARAAAGCPGPVLTVLGSSNHGARSAERDLEAGAVLLTAHAPLRAALGEELRRLRERAPPCAPDAAEVRASSAGSGLFRWLTRTVLASFL